MTPPCFELEVSLPPEFAVVGSGGEDPAHPWAFDDGRDERSSRLRSQVARSVLHGRALLCAVHADLLDGEQVRASLVVSAAPAGPGDLDLDRLHERALRPTSEAGWVSRLALPAGGAVGAVDAVTAAPAGTAGGALSADESGAPAGRPGEQTLGLVEVELPLPHHGHLVRLALWTTSADAALAYSGVVADIAAGIQVHEAAGSPSHEERAVRSGPSR